MWTDFRAKGLRPETVASFTSLGFQSTVSTKFWREHMGLPYHGTRIDPDLRYPPYSSHKVLRSPVAS